jgi:hypothetical protein
MKKVGQFIIVIAFNVLMLPAFAQTNGWKTFDNDKCSLNYPANWTVQELTEDYTSVGIEFSIVSAQHDEKDNFFENVNFLTEKLQDPTMTIDKYAKESDQLLKKVITGYKKISSQKISSDIGDVWLMEYTGKLGPTTLYWLQYNIFRNGENNILSFASTKKDYKMYKSTFESMWQSFNFK